jgi:hypothetical protein
MAGSWLPQSSDLPELQGLSGAQESCESATAGTTGALNYKMPTIAFVER